jgi:hypothetical protein
VTNLPPPIQELIEKLEAELPPVWLGTETDEIMGYSARWRTIQNMLSAGAIPRDCFVRNGLKLLVVRDKFLPWWAKRLAEVAGPQPAEPPKRRGRPRRLPDPAQPARLTEGAGPQSTERRPRGRPRRSDPPRPEA